MDMHYSVTPIGFVRADQRHKYDQPRQGVYARNQGVIELVSGCNYEQALEDLAGFSHIWLIFLFHKNSSWRPKTDPPLSVDGKKGLFATRSPYRPNPIGLSCVKLLGIAGRMVTIADFDLLDGTPILDIKPYIAASDSFPEATTGWLPGDQRPRFTIEFGDIARQKAHWIQEEGGVDLFDRASVQLSYDPLNGEQKRVFLLSERNAILSYRTWRLHFTVSEGTVHISEIKSGYSDTDLQVEQADPHGDKSVHRLFKAYFPGI